MTRNDFTSVFMRRFPMGRKELQRLHTAVGHEPNWEDLTDSVLREYKESMQQELCPSSCRTYSAIFKAILNEYKDENPIPSRNYSKLLTIKGSPSQNIYLTEDEVSRLSQVKTKNNAERYVKAMFLLQCYTGCRHSDAQQLSRTNIMGDWLSYVSIKTKTNTAVPLHAEVPRLIDELKACTPVSDSYYERVIRKLCQRAHICHLTKLYRRGKDSEAPKWRFVASHTGRRTFCTNLYLRGVDLHSISKWMGHSDIKMTEHYLCAENRLPDNAVDFFRNQKQ